MPKMKTKRGAAKRFKLTASGKIKRNKAYHSHELSKLASGKSNEMSKTCLVSKADTKAVKKMLCMA
ncbi:MAG TPA: 50S ribosomal protein L35 [Alphaproteobacteria bacterium]|nr:50S ribosomal protein L35 [Alphaproteobacteria bacterium]